MFIEITVHGISVNMEKETTVFEAFHAANHENNNWISVKIAVGSDMTLSYTSNCWTNG